MTDATTENAVDQRYVRRLLIELLTYLPRNDRPGVEMITLECFPLPTPAETRRQQADALIREADRLERAEKLRAEVEQAIAWLDSTGAEVRE